MRHIEKSQPEPSELLEYRKSAGNQGYWDGFPKKDVVRMKLLQDQGYLCCYCMRRIRPENAKIEHYLPVSIHPGEQLAWKNLLASCDGGRGGPKASRTCDERKGNTRIEIDPQQQRHMKNIRFLGDGSVEYRGEEESYQTDMDENLNLNCQVLKQQRKEALNGLIEGLKKDLGDDCGWTLDRLEKKLKRLREQDRLAPFSAALEQKLEQWIRRGSERLGT